MAAFPDFTQVPLQSGNLPPAGDGYAAWAEQRQERALDEIRCVRDRLPTIGTVPLTSWMPFLAPLAAAA